MGFGTHVAARVHRFCKSYCPPVIIFLRNCRDARMYRLNKTEQGICIRKSGESKETDHKSEKKNASLQQRRRNILSKGSMFAQMCRTMILFFVMSTTYKLGVIAVEGGEEADNTEENPATRVSYIVGIMLMGSFTFMMAMFYLVNHKDADMKRYSWQVISATISIFIAVLLFKGLDGALTESLVEESSWWSDIGMNFAQQLVWFSVLQFALGKSTGALSDVPLSEEVTDHEKEEIEELTMFWGTLIAHINGFACIDSFSSLQQQEPFSKKPVMTMIPVLLAFVWISGMFSALDRYREAKAMEDGHKDEREKLWDEEAEECENDIAGLCLSFLTSQATVFFILGVLPNKEGELEDMAFISGLQRFSALIAVLAFAACSVGAVRINSYLQPEEQTATERLLGILNNWACMSFSWLLLQLSRWEVSNLGIEDPVFFRVIVAIGVSLLAFAVISFLDMIGDGDMTSDSVEKSLRQMIVALAILVGFSWEQAFDIAMLAVSLHLPEDAKKMGKALITIVLVGIVAPAWKMYIIPNYLALQEEHEAHREEIWDDYDHFVHKGREVHKFEAIDQAEYDKLKAQREKANANKVRKGSKGTVTPRGPRGGTPGGFSTPNQTPSLLSGIGNLPPIGFNAMNANSANRTPLLNKIQSGNGAHPV